MSFCKNCGSELREGTVFCGKCGYNVTNIQSTYNQTNVVARTIDAHQKKRYGLIVLISLVIIITVAAIVVISNLLNTENKAVKVFCQFAEACADGDSDKASELFYTDIDFDSRAWDVLSDNFSEGYEVISCIEIDEDIAERSLALSSYNIDDAYEVYYYFDSNLQMGKYYVCKSDGEWIIAPAM